jgi:hypothetical protein
VLGALPRLRNRPRVSQALILALGVSLLAMTRPYEGLFLCLPVAGMLLVRMLRPNMLRPNMVRPNNGTFRVMLPIASVLLLTAAFLAYYSFRVTGKALLMPQVLNQQTYVVVPLFLWQPLRSQPPVYRNQQFRNFYLGWEVSEYRNTITVGFPKMTWIKFKIYWGFYFGPILSIPLIAVSRVLVDRRIRFLLIVLASMTVAAELETWIHPHYIAPMTCVLLAVVLQCMRHLQFWRWHSWQIGQAIVWAVVVGCFALDAAWVSAVAMHVSSKRREVIW